ncbi:Methionyl-tRNA formyltransferase [bioreactor metagenome]|uniref:methionyl-tRNA formyltransferase n=1 Tax=bioreactor metagenome TaxID=1076179 RepID=A0A645BTU9_9ZZZZ
MKKSDLKIVFMGTPGFAVAQLRKIVENGYNVVAVVTAPDKPAGRGMTLTCSEVKKCAITLEIPVLQPVSLKSEDFLETLISYQADLFIVVAFRMLPKVVWSIPELGTFNLHASLLPDYRGAAPINHAIINGETKTGVTTFMLDEEIDTGELLNRQECTIELGDDFGTLHDKLMKIGGELVIKTIEDIIHGRIEPILQSSIEAQMGDVHTAPKLNKENCRIKWELSSYQVHNLVRGLCPYPTAHTIISGKGKEIPVKIFRTSYSDQSHGLNQVTIISDGKQELKVACGNGFVNILELQVAGKKRMTIKEFLAGFRDSELYKFI